jgi:hypothetical protein
VILIQKFKALFLFLQLIIQQNFGNVMKLNSYVTCLLVLLSLNVFAQNDTINKTILLNAQKVIGLDFSESERDSMTESINQRLDNYELNHKIRIPNSVPPSIMFNPIPIGFVPENKVSKVDYSDYSFTKIPEDKDALAYYSVGQLAHLIETKQISSVELTKFFLKRLKSYNEKLYCVITFTEDLALKQAEKADNEIAAGNYKGMLHGIPYGAKDLLAVKGYKTTWGAMPFKDQIINEDATVIKKLEEAGAVLIAKLTMGALAWGDVWFDGKTRNPWNTDSGSSGSSAGSAASVSAGLLPFAIGTETWGSIVSPSTVCGVTGLRPTYGRVSRHGAMALSWTMDKIGPICRNAEDLAIVFEAIYGLDENDQMLYDYPFSYSQNIDYSKLKIGYLKSDFEIEDSFDENDKKSFSKVRRAWCQVNTY